MNKSLGLLLLMLAVLLSPFKVAAQQYNLSNGQYPPCNTTWQVNGNIYTCSGNGKVTLSSGDIIIANTESTIVADNGFELRGNVIGSQANKINLQADYGQVQTFTTQTTTIYGNITATSSNINLSYLSLHGNIISGGIIILNHGVVEGHVTSQNKSVDISNIQFSGDIRANDAVNITGGTYSGNITMSANNPVTFNSVTMTSGSVSGANRFHASNSTLGSLSTPISVTTNSNEITITNSTVYGNLTSAENNQGGVVNVNNSSVIGNCLPSTNPLNACMPAAVALYRFEEAQWTGQVGEVKNAVSNALHGRAINGAITNNTSPALPVDFNNMGTCGYGEFIGNQNQYVDIPHNPQLSFSDRLTVSAWVYPVSRPTGNGLHTIVAKDDNYEFHLDSQGRVFWYWATSNNSSNSLRTNQSIPLNTWSHITIRYDRTLSGNQRQRIYINGVSVASSDDLRSLRPNTRNLEIGRDFGFDSRSFDGRIDEVAIYGAALTDNQIASLYNQRYFCGGDIPQCFSDDFNRSNLEQDWVPFTSSGNFTPRIVSDRLRLTEAIGNQATAVTYQRIFPAANNLVQVELDYYAWANLTGDGADGISLIFSDATVTPRTGGFGGSLGYAPRNPTSTTPAVPGFAGGWLGIGLDEWGNFANPTEGRVGGVGFIPQSITVRGSQASNYQYLTHQTVSPKIDLRPTNTPGPGDRYLIEIDSRNANQVLLSIRRTNNNTTTTIFNQYSIPLNQQGAIPEEFFLSLAGSTGGSVNHHEIDNFRVCALNSRPVGPQINHFRITLPQQALTCDVADVSVRACANSDCSSSFTDPVTAYLKPNSLPSATGGWVNGSTLSLNSGIGLTQLRRNQAGTVEVGVSGSNPTAVAFNNTKCSYNGSDFSEDNCVVEFVDSGFVLDVPHAYANQSVTARIRAVRKDDASQQCVPSFGDVSKEVALWSKYITPSGGPGFLAMNVVVDGSPISNNIAAPSPHSLYFDQNGQAEFQLTYREAGSLALHASFTGTDDEQDLQLQGETIFVRVPKALIVRAENYHGEDQLCDSDYIECGIFARAGEDFKLTISPIAYSSNDDHLPISNFEYQGLELSNDVVAPAKIELGGRDGQLNNPSYDHQLGDTTTIWRNINEVGVFQFSMKPPTDYWLTESLSINLAEEGLEIEVVPSGPIGRFIPAYFAVSPMTVTLAAACSTGGQPFTYLGQPFGYANNPGLYLQPKSGSGSDTLNYLIGDWWRYDNDWENREYINNINNLTVEKISLNANVIRQPSLGSGVILNDEQLSYQKPIDPMVPFNADFNLHLSINDLRDSDDVCYRASYSEPCLGYIFENIDQSMPLYWGRLTIENVDGPETQGLQQKILSEYYTSAGFVTNSYDNCTELPVLSAFEFQSDDFSVNQGGPTPPLVTVSMQPDTSPFTLVQGVRRLDYTAPGVGNRGVIKALLDLEEHGLSWLRRYNPQNGIWDDSVAGQVQFGIYSGSNRVIWWRETN
ncbi:DUF6701 domain-containing protein [Vibrio metschnikovii]|uniref:DUF6701 domain-containing protein n=1 Tax=Vibrio metschnikovii TaxID=28172 RepID=UPI003BB79967